MPASAARPAAALSVRSWGLGLAGLCGLAVVAGLYDARTSLLVTMHLSSLPRSPVVSVAGVLLGWLAFSVALRLLGRGPRPDWASALGLSALARTALLPQALLLPLLGGELAKVEVDIESAIPLKASSFTPLAWGLMVAYTLTVILALWAHIAAYRRGHPEEQRSGAAGFLPALAAAAAAQQAIQWGLGALLR